MLSILKEGYAIGGKVPKINTNTLKQEFFCCYCFKIRIAEESLRSNFTKGVIDRSFQFKASKGKPTHDIKEVIQPANRNERLEKLHNDFRSFKKLLLVYDTIYRNTVGKIISDNFGAEPKHMRDGNAFVFDLEKLAKAGRSYDVEVSFQTNLHREGCEGGEGSYDQKEDNSNRGIPQHQENNGNISNNDDIRQQVSEEIKKGKWPMPGIEPSHSSI